MKIILGDNPFFSINHRIGPSESPAVKIEQLEKVLTSFLKLGGETMMLSVQPGYEGALKVIQQVNQSSEKELQLALVIPSLHTWNKLVAEGGWTALIKECIRNFVSAINMRSIRSAFIWKSFPYSQMFTFLIQDQKKLAMKMGIKVSHICLHNVFVDMLLGTQNGKKLLDSFLVACKAEGVLPVIITQNIKNLMDLEISGRFTVCFSLNSKGYMVNPDLKSVISEINEAKNNTNRNKIEMWAMQALASGAVDAKAAREFLEKENIDAMVYGTSRQERITQIFSE
ncbi:hypothetical protein N9C64_00640 [Paracoccaceae bacterium]|nr:hypothetical protein [Paracoccaceae bacterium]